MEDLIIPKNDFSAQNPYGLGLADLAQSLYELNEVATFSAELIEGPEALLIVTLGLTGPPGRDLALRAKKALNGLLKDRLALEITLNPTPAPPAPGGAKPSLGRSRGV
jgi:hypothetical protein